MARLATRKYCSGVSLMRRRRLRMGVAHSGNRSGLQHRRRICCVDPNMRLLAGAATLLVTLAAASPAAAQSSRWKDFPMPFDGKFRGIAAGPDNAVWAANDNGNRIVRVSTSGQISV